MAHWYISYNPSDVMHYGTKGHSGVYIRSQKTSKYVVAPKPQKPSRIKDGKNTKRKYKPTINSAYDYRNYRSKMLTIGKAKYYMNKRKKRYRSPNAKKIHNIMLSRYMPLGTKKLLISKLIPKVNIYDLISVYKMLPIHEKTILDKIYMGMYKIHIPSKEQKINSAQDYYNSKKNK